MKVLNWKYDGLDERKWVRWTNPVDRGGSIGLRVGGHCSGSYHSLLDTRDKGGLQLTGLFLKSCMSREKPVCLLQRRWTDPFHRAAPLVDHDPAFVPAVFCLPIALVGRKRLIGGQAFGIYWAEKGVWG